MQRGFEKFITHRYYLIDKTLLIKDLIDNKADRIKKYKMELKYDGYNNIIKYRIAYYKKIVL